MAARFVIPSRQYADLIVSGVEPLDTSVSAVLGAIAPAALTDPRCDVTTPRRPFRASAAR
jgi:hypothetical protein